MNFTHILGFKEENFAVGSLTGELRLYSKIGENAKNLLPSYLGDKIIDMDQTRDGNFILLTFKNYLILFQTFQRGRSGFDYTFQKGEKMNPKILKINPKLMYQLNI